MKTIGRDEAAAILHVHPVTLSEMASAGKIRGAKIGREWVFLERDVELYLIEQINSQTKERQRLAAPPPPPRKSSGRRRRPLPVLPEGLS